MRIVDSAAETSISVAPGLIASSAAATPASAILSSSSITGIPGGCLIAVRSAQKPLASTISRRGNIELQPAGGDPGTPQHLGQAPAPARDVRQPDAVGDAPEEGDSPLLPADGLAEQHVSVSPHERGIVEVDERPVPLDVDIAHRIVLQQEETIQVMPPQG